MHFFDIPVVRSQHVWLKKRANHDRSLGRDSKVAEASERLSPHDGI